MSNPVILHVAGTMGSGKTTLIKNTLGVPGGTPQYEEGRKAPVGYVLHLEGVERPVFVAGSYAVATASGCDTIKDTGHAYDLVWLWWERGHHVVYEGLFMMNHTRGVQLQHATRALTVLRLTTPLDQCEAGVRARRAAAGNDKPLPPRFFDGLRGNAVRAHNYARKMSAAGARTFEVDRDGGPGVLLGSLRGAP